MRKEHTRRRGRSRTIYASARDVEDVKANFAFLTEIPVNRTLSSSESREWMEAMANEVKSIFTKNTWNLVDRSEASDVIGSRFILCNKYGANGGLEKRKARIVAKGYSQQYEQYFHKTFAPVARLASIRSTIALAVK